MEKRYTRVEDWKGNVYLFESSGSSSGTSGIVTDAESASNDPNNPPYTDGTLVSDPNANGGKAIILTSGTTRKTLYAAEFANLMFGKVAVAMRMKSSVGTGIVDLIEVNAYFVDASGEEPSYTLLDTVRYNGSDFGVANEYTVLGAVFDYKGVSTGDTRLKIEIIVLPDTGVTFYFDQMTVAMEMPSSDDGKSAYVENTTVVLP